MASDTKKLLLWYILVRVNHIRLLELWLLWFSMFYCLLACIFSQSSDIDVGFVSAAFVSVHLLLSLLMLGTDVHNEKYLVKVTQPGSATKVTI